MWLLRKTFDLVSSQVPGLNEAIMLMGAGLGEAEREEKVFAEIKLYVREGRPVVEQLDRLYAELRLNDLRKV